MKNIILLGGCLVAMVTTSITCRKNRADCHIYYTIKNNSNKAIYFISNKDSALNLLSYPPGASPATYKCGANAKTNDAQRSCYESNILLSPTKMLNIFIVDAQTIETVPWDTIKQNYMLLKRYSLTKAQLDSADWIINYP